eukprot:5313140-Prymnesium_polylepis.1
MHPRSADMHAALTAEPHGPRNFLGGRSAHARDLVGGTLHLSSLDVAAPKTGAPAGIQRVDRCSSQIDSGTA